MWAALSAMIVAVAGCADGNGDDPEESASGAYPVAVERATFAPHQHVGQRSVLTLRVRNAGSRTIPDLVVTLHGLSDRVAGRDAWLVDEPPVGVTASDDTWAAGALAAGRTVTLRWAATPVVAGARELRYEISPSAVSGGRTTLPGGGDARGALTVRVSDRPAQARVVPGTGAVVRGE